MAGKGLGPSSPFWVGVGGLMVMLFFLLQQEAESVLAQQDDWSPASQASRAGQVSWVGQGVCIHGKWGLAPPSLSDATSPFAAAHEPQPQVPRVRLEWLGS